MDVLELEEGSYNQPDITSQNSSELFIIRPGQTVVQCKYCFKKYKLVGALTTHEKSCAKRNTANASEETRFEEPEDVQSNNDNRCKDCGQTFKYAKILQKHELMHKDKNSFWCKLCFVSFPTFEDKVVHKLNRHPVIKGKKNKCKACPDLTFTSEEEYLYHISEVHKGKFEDYFMCSECGKQFRTKTELTHHNNSKCGTIRQYKCKVCGQELMTAGSLHNHMLRHKGERSSMCGFCGKTFLTAGQLKVHERSHTQEKAFICQECGKGFCHRQSLITHSSIHTGIKPYVCDNCSQEFSCVGNLMKHRKTHADTCGSVPSTTHRVNHPMTKRRVQLNTPKNSKLKAMAREKERLEKVAAYKEKITQQDDLSDNKCDENGCVDNEVQIVNTQHFDCSLEQQNGINMMISGNDENASVNGYECEMKNELLVAVDNVAPCISTSFVELQINNTLEIDKCSTNQILNHNLTNCTNKQTITSDKDFFSISTTSYQDYSNQFHTHEDKYIEHNLDSAYKTLKANDSNFITLDTYTATHKTKQTSNDTYTTKHQEENIVTSPVKIENLNESSNSDEEHDDTNENYESDEENEEKTKLLTKVRKRKVDFQKGLVDDNKATKGCCKHCGKVYSNVRWLTKHEEQHQQKNTETSEIKTNKISFKCSCCKVGFESREECKVHQQTAHADILTCHDCDKVFSNVDSLRSHQNIFHKGVPKKVYLYICDKCGMQFRQKAFLTHHEQNNCGSEPIYKCHICGKGFSSVYTRRSHLRIHDPKKRFLCKFCGKSFRWKGQLKIHERSHTGEKPFKCLYCPKAFAYRESLLTHSTIHTGIKPHLCQACGSRFSCIGNLIKHRGTHASSCGVWYSKNQ